mgnify:FL=1
MYLIQSDTVTKTDDFSITAAIPYYLDVADHNTGTGTGYMLKSGTAMAAAFQVSADGSNFVGLPANNLFSGSASCNAIPGTITYSQATGASETGTYTITLDFTLSGTA